MPTNGTNGEKPIPFRYPVIVWIPFILSILLIPSETLGHTFTGRVTRVIDGDTFCVLTDLGERLLRVRLAEIDAPEMKTTHGPAAKAALAEMIEGKVVVVRWEKRGRYRRIIGSVYIQKRIYHEGHEEHEDRSVNLWMVEQGWARLFRRYSRSEELAEAELSARARLVGMWRLSAVSNDMACPVVILLERTRDHRA